jgi:hypothetical protein
VRLGRNEQSADSEFDLARMHRLRMRGEMINVKICAGAK